MGQLGRESLAAYKKPDPLREDVEAFIAHAQGLGRSPRTIERHRTSFSLLWRYLEERGVQDAAALTPQVLAGFQAWLYQTPSRYGRPYKVTSQIITLSSLQVFGHFLVASGRLLTDPAEAIRLPRAPKRLPGMLLTAAEMRRILRQPDTSTVLGFRDRTIYEVLYSTGLRVRELTGLRVEDLNFSGGAIRIPEGKHAKERYVPFGAVAGRYLAEYLKHVRGHLVRREVEDLAFLSRQGARLDVSGVEKKLRIYGHRAGIKKHLTVHVFRHTLATEMLRRGADLRQIQEMLGHRSLTTTQIYTHIVKGELKRVQAHCHPREQVNLPEGFVRYRGRRKIEAGER